MSKKNIVEIIIIVVLAIVLASVFRLYINEIKSQKTDMFSRKPMMVEEDKTKDTTAEDVDAGETVNTTEINLSDYDSNLTISEAGTYTLTGSFKNSVVVKADGDVTLILNGVTIESTVTAAIANGGTNALTIKLADGTVNNLSDGGSSEYDGCIFSYGTLTIEGEGTLNVNGKQEEGEGIATKSCDLIINSGIINVASQDDGLNTGGTGGSIIINGGTIYVKANGDGIDSNGALTVNGGEVYAIGSSQGGDAGIDTDEGYVFNGGNVIAIGSDMLEKPEESSKQKYACFSLSTTVKTGSSVEVKNNAGDVVASFEAKDDFKTLIISSEKVADEEYSVYVNGEIVK